MADDPSTPAPDGADPADPQEPDPQPQGGDDGTDWKAMARKHEREAKKARHEAEELRKKHQSAEEAALEQAKADGRSERDAELGGQLVSLRVENAVLRSEHTKKLADPDDALLNIKAETVLDDDGNVDPKALGKAIDDLIERKPHLAAGAPTPKVPTGPRGPQGGTRSMNDLIRAGRS